MCEPDGNMCPWTSRICGFCTCMCPHGSRCREFRGFLYSHARNCSPWTARIGFAHEPPLTPDFMCSERSLCAGRKSRHRHAKLKDRVNRACDVVRDDLHQKLVRLRFDALAPEGIAEQPLHRGERRFNVAALVVVRQKLVDAVRVEVKELRPRGRLRIVQRVGLQRRSEEHTSEL